MNTSYFNILWDLLHKSPHHDPAKKGIYIDTNSMMASNKIKNQKQKLKILQKKLNLYQEKKD